MLSKEDNMAETKKRETRALVTLHGYKEPVELVEIVNDTAVLILKGMRTMTGIWNIETVNKKAKDLIAAAKAED